jgi:hypothetical protein
LELSGLKLYVGDSFELEWKWSSSWKTSPIWDCIKKKWTISDINLCAIRNSTLRLTFYHHIISFSLWYILCSFFFWAILWCSQFGDHHQKDLAKFG